MIRLLTDKKTAEFLSFCEDKLTGAVIYTRLKAYGTDCNDVLFWYGEDESGSINGVFSMADGVFSVCVDETADREEIAMFASAVGAAEITYGKAAYTLKFCGSEKDPVAENIDGENLRHVFPVIFEEDENSEKYFARWYTDASQKIRHGLIRGKGIFIDGKCVSVALTSGETDSVAVISSVATLKDYRGHGYGERVVLSLAKSLEKKVYLMTDSEKTKTWYEKMGFKSI